MRQRVKGIKLKSNLTAGLISKNNQFLSHELDLLISNRSLVSYVSIKSNEINFIDEDYDDLEYAYDSI